MKRLLLHLIIFSGMNSCFAQQTTNSISRNYIERQWWVCCRVWTITNTL